MSGAVLIIGASGLAREVIAAGLIDVVGIVDDEVALHGARVGGVPVVGAVGEVRQRNEQLLVCVGSGAGRRAIVGRLRALGIDEGRFATVVARSAAVGRTSSVGPGSILLDGVAVTADARIGEHVVVMPNCTVTHDDLLEDFVTLAAGVSLGGGVTIGEASYLGMNASVRQGTTVGAAATIGMGAAVVRDVPAGETWVGVPARAVRRRT